MFMSLAFRSAWSRRRTANATCDSLFLGETPALAAFLLVGRPSARTLTSPVGFPRPVAAQRSLLPCCRAAGRRLVCRSVPADPGQRHGGLLPRTGALAHR